MAHFREPRHMPIQFAEFYKKQADLDLKIINSVPREEFPLHIFSPTIQQILQELHDKLNFPISYTACSLLYAASVAIGNTYKLRYRWDVKANLFIVLVGKPGTNKSHPIEFAITPILNKDQKSFHKYEKLMDEYENWSNSNSKKKMGGAIKKPILEQIIVSDISIEALKAILYTNKRGVGLYSDEIAGWLNSFKKYNSALEQWLSIWSGKEIIHQRKNSRPYRISDPFASVIGTMQTEIIEQIAAGNQLKNGFMDRILFVNQPNLERIGWKTNTSELESTEQWNKILGELLDLDFDTESGIAVSHFLHFTPEAEQIIIEWQNQNIKNDKEQSGEMNDGISAKMEIHVLRFSLIFQLLKWACGAADKSAIDRESAESAIALSTLFKTTSMDIFEHVSRKNPIDRLSPQRKAIYKNMFNSFSTAEGVELAGIYLMPERTFKHWLASDDKLFIRVGHGQYTKRYKS